MRVASVKKISGKHSLVRDCTVGDGYILTSHASFPDIDCDYDSERREDVKRYLEGRYDTKSQSRVFSAGALTLIKVKSAMKDIAATHKVPRSTTNYITSIIDNDDITWTGLMKLAYTDKRVKDFIQKFPDVFEEMLPLLGQGRSKTIHPSAVIVSPKYINGEQLNCYELLPVKWQSDMMVSELNGVEIDAIGILKNDILAIKELNRISAMFQLIKGHYNIEYNMLQIITQYLDDKTVYDTISAGHTQGLFQMSGGGMSKYIKRMQPNNIEDLIAAIALFRPGTLDSGAAENYVLAKHGEYEPEYLWGTYEILKDTYGQMCYQEQVSQVAQRVGSLSLGDGVNLVKALSKKKLNKVRQYKEKFFTGAAKNGCPLSDAEKIWTNIELASKYSFNRSHAVAYGLTAYVGAWIKTHYPTVFYTVVLNDVDEDKLPIVMREIKKMHNTGLIQPDINISGASFTADFKNNSIYWSFGRIKQVGPKAVEYIVQERNLYGDFDNMEDFITRITKRRYKGWNDGNDEVSLQRCPITARTVRHLILSGAFDKTDNVSSLTERYGLLVKAANLLGFTVSEDEIPEQMRVRHYFWSRLQINIAGIGLIDYERIYHNTEMPQGARSQSYITFEQLDKLCFDIKRGVICCTITSIDERSYKDASTGMKKSFGKIALQQNMETALLTIWDSWSELKGMFKNGVGKLLIAVVNVKWSDYDDAYVFQINKNVFLQLI